MENSSPGPEVTPSLTPVTNPESQQNRLQSAADFFFFFATLSDATLFTRLLVENTLNPISQEKSVDTQPQVEPQPITVDQLPKAIPEIPKDAFIPMLLLQSVREPKIPITDAIQREVQRASLATLKLLGVDITKYQGNKLSLEDLVDTDEVNSAGKLTLKRKDGSDKDALAIILSGNPINTGLSEDNKIFIDISSLDKYILNRIPQEKKAGILAVQEAIHYVQHVYWKRQLNNNMDTINNPELHNQDPLEKEMHPLWVKICQMLYK